MDTVTDKKIEDYFKITGEAIEKIKVPAPAGTPLNDVAIDFLDMAQRYYDDAKHFLEKGDKVTCFGALNYAHGWLDAGARMGLFDVDHDSRLFTVD